MFWKHLEASWFVANSKPDRTGENDYVKVMKAGITSLGIDSYHGN